MPGVMKVNPGFFLKALLLQSGLVAATVMRLPSPDSAISNLINGKSGLMK